MIIWCDWIAVVCVVRSFRAIWIDCRCGYACAGSMSVKVCFIIISLRPVMYIYLGSILFFLNSCYLNYFNVMILRIHSLDNWRCEYMWLVELAGFASRWILDASSIWVIHYFTMTIMPFMYWRNCWSDFFTREGQNLVGTQLNANVFPPSASACPQSFRWTTVKYSHNSHIFLHL